MNTNPKDENFDDMAMPPSETGDNRPYNSDVREQRPRTAPLEAPDAYPAYPPPLVQAPLLDQPVERRRRGRWPWVVGCLIALLVVVVVVAIGAIGLGYAFHLGPSTTTTRHFPVRAHPTIVINNDVGNILVHTGGATSTVTIAETRSGTLFGGSPNNVQVAYSASNGGNTITVNVTRPGGANFFNSSSVDFDVSAPNTANLQLKTNTGSINASGISGQMSLISNTGSVNATQLSLTGSATLKTNTGSIDFSGKIGTAGTYQFGSNTGTVNVTLPGSSSFHLTARTDTGSFSTDFPGVRIQHNTTGAQASGDVGASPTAMVILTANTGSVSLNKGI